MRHPVLLDVYSFFLLIWPDSALRAYGGYLKPEQTSV
jgi:hypothetical protein